MGRFTGPNGAGFKAQLWKSFAAELNSLGPPRTAEQWKTVILFQFLTLQLIYFLPFFFQTFNTIKAAAKAKLADDHNNGSIGKPLTRLEEKIVSIYGMDCMDGIQGLGETGFQYKKV